MNNYMNNPMMDMFKKSMENPMAMWSKESWAPMMEAMQNNDMTKGFSCGDWMAIPNKMMGSMPWSADSFNPGNNMKHVESFADMHKVSLESAQAMLRRQAEVIQKHSADLYSLMQNMVSSPNPETAMSMQSEYMQMAFEALVADFKELAEMYSKANLEAFEVASSKVGEHINKMSKNSCSMKKNACSSHEEHAHHGHEQNAKNNKKK
jgi:phasin family protein